MSEIFQFKDTKFDNIKDCIEYIREDCEGEVAGKEFVIKRIISTGEDEWGTYSETQEVIELRLAVVEVEAGLAAHLTN
jgi:hypothetical protein